MKNRILAISFSFLIVSTAFSQDNNNKQEIKIKDVTASLDQAPRYAMSGQQPQADQSKKWLVIEAILDSEPEWADEVTLKFYVAAQYFKEKDRFDILATTVTVVNVPKNPGGGKKNIVPVFLDPNSVKKYGGSGTQFVLQIAVQVYYKGRLQDTFWMTPLNKGKSFWESTPPRGGVLLNLMQSPWSPAFIDYYEQVKPASAVPAAY